MTRKTQKKGRKRGGEQSVNSSIPVKVLDIVGSGVRELVGVGELVVVVVVVAVGVLERVEVMVVDEREQLPFSSRFLFFLCTKEV